MPTSLKPQTTVNYQIGTAYQQDRFTAGFDIYYIYFRNYIPSQSNSTGTIYTNNGGAVFKGIEAESTAKLGLGVSLYGNATMNDATYNRSGFPVAFNPRTTMGAGPILHQNRIYGSFLWKYIAPQYTLEGSCPFSQATFPIKGYNDADFAAGYTLVLHQIDNKSVNFRLNVRNVFNNHSLVGLIGATANGQALYATNPGGVSLSRFPLRCDGDRARPAARFGREVAAVRPMLRFAAWSP